MITNSTLSTINYIKDLDYNQDMKMLFILTFLVYALIMFWLDRKYLRNDNRASFKLLSLGFKVYYFTILIFIPRFITLFSRTEDIGFLLLLQTYIYSIGALFLIIVLALYLFERFFKDYLGIEITLDGLKLKTFKMEGFGK